MITVGVIRNGERYLSRHLRKNDYWSEGEKEVQGEWIGEAAKALGLSGIVDDPAFEALRNNKHPRSAVRLTNREKKNRVAFFDIQLSAPKDVSVLAMVGGDDRVRAAFVESVKVAIAEMERFAAVRERRGDAAGSEKFRLSENFVGAMFLHDASRDLDPQLHVHAVLANATFDRERNEWMALQPAEMLRASPYIRQVLYRELAGRLRQLGYEPHSMSDRGFAVRGIEHLRERFSKRAAHVERLKADFARDRGRQPTKAEVEVLVKESRRDKLTEATTAEVRARQRSELSHEEYVALERMVAAARKSEPKLQISHGMVRSVLEAALKHVYERNSVAREAEVLRAALALHPDFNRWRELREALTNHPDAVRRHGEMTLRSISAEEARAAQRLRDGRNTRLALGDPEQLPERLTKGQRRAAEILLRNRDFVSILVGDAGTGKTRVLSGLESAHLAAGGQKFVPLAPTTRAREALSDAGFDAADTVQRFLVSEPLQRAAERRVLLVDEAGLLSTQQMDELTRIARDLHSRILLVGDIKQHYSVQRGDALRNLIERADAPVVRLSEVLRQRSEADRSFSRMLARGEVYDAVLYAEGRGMVHQLGDGPRLFEQAAARYAANIAAGVDTLVVIPFWEEIDQFNPVARTALRNAGALQEAEVVRTATHPLAWTEEQKIHWDQYNIGDRLLFVRDTRVASRGTSLRVTRVLKNGVEAADEKGVIHKITRRQRGSYDVGRERRLGLSIGDKVLIRGRDARGDFSNGDLKIVGSVDNASDRVIFTDGKVLPPEFHAWTYGHALTSYRAQGSTAEESILILGGVAERAVRKRQFYVGNTRYRGAHEIYVSDAQAILRRLAQPDDGRELASEFFERNGVTLRENLTLSRKARERVSKMWSVMRDKWRTASTRETTRAEV